MNIKKSAMQTTAKLENFLSVFEIPDFIKPWIDRFFEDIDIELVMRLSDHPLSRNEINRTFRSAIKPDPPDSDFATRAYRKGIINRRGDGRFEPADFHARFDKWAMFEGWQDIPDEIRSQLNAWELGLLREAACGSNQGLEKGTTAGTVPDLSRIYFAARGRSPVGPCDAHLSDAMQLPIHDAEMHPVCLHLPAI